LQLGPLAGHHVGIGFVLARRLLAQPEPLPIRRRDVLRRVVSALLILGPTISRPDIEALVLLAAGLHPEGDAHKSARIPAGARSRFARHFEFDRTVVKLGS